MLVGRWVKPPHQWGHSSAGRAPAWHAGGQRFESAWLHFFNSLFAGGFFGDQVGYAVALFGAQFLLSTAKPGSAVRTFCVTAYSSLLVSEVVQFSMSVDRALVGWARACTHCKPWRDAVLHRVAFRSGCWSVSVASISASNLSVSMAYPREALDLWWSRAER